MPDSTAAVAGGPAHPAGPPMLMIIRHAEKPTPGDGQRGVTPTGDHDDHCLSVRGWTRAGALVGLFCPQHGEPRPGLARPDAIYASGRADDGSHRPVQTVTPLAQRLGLDIHRDLGAGQEAELASRLAGRAGATLVSWQHEAIPQLVALLGPVGPAAPPHWPDDRFDVVWTLTRAGDGWRFAQVAQLLLAGDRADPLG